MQRTLLNNLNPSFTHLHHLPNYPSLLQSAQHSLYFAGRNGHQQPATGLRRETQRLLRLAQSLIKTDPSAIVLSIIVRSARIHPRIAQLLRARQPRQSIKVKPESNH